MIANLNFDSYDVRMSDVNTRVEVVDNRESELILIRQYRDRGFTVENISDIYSGDESSLLKPSKVLARFSECSNSDHVVITGFSYYLPLWNDIHVNDFFGMLRDLLDSQKSGLILVIQRNAFNESLFTNPKYGMGRIVYLNSSNYHHPDNVQCTVAILDETLAPPSFKVGSFRELAEKICNPQPDCCRIYAIAGRASKKPGAFNASVSWPTSAREVLDAVWGYKDDIPPETYPILLKSCIENTKKPIEYLDSILGEGNSEPSRVLNRICELSDNPILPALLTYLMRKVPANSYIQKALETYVGKGTFLHHYIVTAAIENVGDGNQKYLANERKSAIKQCSTGSEKSLISEFVFQVMEFSEAICWLNCGTDSEKCDLIRRAGSYNLHGSFPEEISNLYPLLRDYMGKEFQYEDEVLTNYFSEYRICKITNVVSSAFLNTVNETKAKRMGVQTRTSALSEYSDDEETALLIVDGLGAEYLPLLVSLLKARGLNVERADVVKAELPTSTEFNPTFWNNKLRDIKGVDNTAHDGAEKHVQTKLEENIYATFQIIEREVVNSIANNIGGYKRIIITADHGLTRLAACAYNDGKSNTLDFDGDTWRYRDSTEDDRTPPANVDVTYNDKTGRHYWTIRNYDRFKKSGSIKYETHGGSSVEEMMVPFIVVARDANDIVKPKKRISRSSNDPSSQIKVDNSLDELFG